MKKDIIKRTAIVRSVALVAVACLLLTAVSCRQGNISNPLTAGSVGSPWEVLVVMDKSQWENTWAGRALFDVLDEDLPALPQSEPRFKISRCDRADFMGILKPVRNIIETEISRIYSAPKLHFYKDLWATNQYVIKIVAPDNDSFAAFVTANSEAIYDYFDRGERERALQYHRRAHNRDLSALVMKKFGYRIWVPKFMKKYKLGENFIWLSNDQNRKHQDMVIYSYPYTDPATFTPAYLNAKRDSIMKANIPGGPEGSYMARQEKEQMTFRELNVNGKYAVEIRGLWEMRKDMMGGPYVSLTRLDEVSQRVVTVEVFIYAPEENKRNLLKHNEAALYSLKLPGEFSEE